MAPQKNTPDEVSDKTSALKASTKTVSNHIDINYAL